VETGPNTLARSLCLEWLVGAGTDSFLAQYFGMILILFLMFPAGASNDVVYIGFFFLLGDLKCRRRGRLCLSCGPAGANHRNVRPKRDHQNESSQRSPEQTRRNLVVVVVVVVVVGSN
jgi:hypothetical protein